ncbi:cobalt chelatase [Streptomyces sp. NBC_01306]|uniref:cobaltochelatase CobT-related protein n=1 Tax=Streptomyces sp. NBC_01306 TaxID=2903819 RepID=UPI002250FF95|nr:cobalt chelatase [Streptomyces sp. NBC_01306]MCX4728960.1 cobalt chelatase [Streptomyces sp. NBC_01306]
MGGTQAAVRHRQQVQELCGAAVRALCGVPDLHFRGGQPHRGRQALPVFAPHLYPSAQDDFGSFRGAADGLALRLAHSDQELHRRLCPDDRTARLVFEMLEQFRAESLAPAHLPGMEHNLQHRHEQWSLAFHQSGLTETATGLLLHTVAQVCRARITGRPVVEETEGIIEATRGALAPVIGHELAGLRQDRFDQARFAVHALAIARAVAGMTASAGAAAHRGRAERADDVRPAPPRNGFTLLTDFDDGPAGSAAALHGTDTGEGDGYRVFTITYDRQRRAGTLVRPAALTGYREQLDRRIASQGINLSGITRELTARLATPVTRGWDGAQEEGYIDGRMLARLIGSPTERRVFRSERTEPATDARVTFLIDCSGSMKEYGESLALLVDVFARALDRAGAECEILGFTTGAWNGGRARRDWLRAGRPPRPGRLNEQCHLVFKDAATPWRTARRDIAALLKPDLFREGVDGEAVAWAARRTEGTVAERGPGSRRLLFVLSDGGPMDTATQLANDDHFLDRHLKDVVARYEQSGAVEVHGVGLGLDLSPYYRSSRVLDLSRGPDNGVFREILGLIG